MRNRNPRRLQDCFQRTLLVLAIDWLACQSSLAQQVPAAGAQDTSTEAGAAIEASASSASQTIVVSGTRASLARSLLLKRNSAVVQDSISATELGRFPDANVADSLSHINGISITRTTGGEGQYVGVRGLGAGYNIVTLNDRILATDGNGRDFAFDVLPSEVISGADVLKSPQASAIEGSIGGTVNLRSARPFDQPGLHAGLRVEGERNSLSGLKGNKLSAVFSNTSSGGQHGLTLGAVLSRSNVRTDSLNYNTYDTSNPGSFDLNGDGTLGANEQNLIANCCIAFGSVFEKKKRLALSGAYEWRPSDSLRMTVDAIATHLDSPQVGYNQAYYVAHAEDRWSNVVAKDGLITQMTVNQFVPEIANITIDRVVDTRQFGWNGEWKASPELKLTGDAYRSTSVRNEGGKDTFVVSGIAGNNTARWSARPGGLPDIAVTLEDGRDLGKALAAGQLGDKDYGLHYVGLSGSDIHDTVSGLATGLLWSVDKGMFESLQFGLSQTQRDKTRDFVGNDQTGGSCQYCDMYGTTFASLGEHVVSPLTLPNFMQGAGGNFPRSFVRFDVPAYFNALKKLDGQPVMQDGQPTGATYNFADSLAQRDPTNSYDVRERTTTAYLQGNFSDEGWSGNVGLRLVRTATVSATAINRIVAIDDPTPNVPTSSPDVTYSLAEPISERASYTQLLPSANLSWWLDKTLQLRLGAAKVMARPSLDQLAPTRTDTTIDRVYTITIAGNARLKPTQAVQQDASLEWYYQPKSALTAALFAKQIRNFVTTQTTRNVDIGVPGYLYTVVSPINGDKGSIAGIELGWQHMFDNGFGFRTQLTKNRSKAWVQGQFTGQLEGVAPATQSLGLLYEQGPLSASVSFDHTGHYVVNHSTEAGLPNIAAPLTWVTASAGWEFNDKLRFFVEGKNLSNAVYRSNLGRDDASYGFAAWGRTITLGASLKL